MVGKKFYSAQSATEYLLTYGWAFLIAAIVVASLYLFVFAPSTLTPSSCTFYSGVFCQDLILGSSATLSKMAMLLTNSNPYPILNPKIIVNISGVAPIQGTCVPNFVLPGGAVICSATISPALSQGALASGRFIFSYTPCPGGNVTQCAGNTRQSYTGSYNTHVSPLLSPTDITITLAAQNSSQVAISTALDKLTANVRLLGTPLSGATVNFTSNSINAPISPLVITTDGSGNAVTYISSSVSGNVFVTASFANVIANTVITFLPPVCYTISVPGLSGAGANALTIDGVGYSSFPQQLCYGQGTTHTYSFQTTVSGGAGIQYLFNFVSGCGATTQSGTLSGIANCTLNGNYTKQYFLTTSASPGIGGTVTPPSGWYNAGNSAALGETPSAGYLFNGWTGSGSGSYTGASTSPSVTLNNPITETGSFTSTSTSTTTTSTTSSTSSTTSLFPVTNNPTSGNYAGDIVYTVSTTLTGAVVGVNMISINSGVTVDECGHYLEGNAEIINRGIITDSCTGGSSGGGAGSSRTSQFFSQSLVAGHGGGAGGAGGGGGSGNSQGCSACAGNGGSGGRGGGIVELYTTIINNQGTINAAGFAGSGGGAGGFCACNCPSGTSGAGGGGGGGSGGTIMIGYSTSVTFGTLNVGSGSPGSGGPGGSGSGGGCCTSSGGGGASGSGTSGGSGGNGGATFDARCSSGPGPGAGGAGGTGYSPASGSIIETPGWSHS